jgi:ParB family chromosome partitioning protein
MDSDGGCTPESLQLVALGDIDSADERFRITTRRDSEDLRSSIRRMGLLSAPLVLRQSSGFMLVSGFRRVAACRSLGWERVRAVVLASGASLYTCACRAVGDNSTQRPLDLIETGRSLRLLERHSPDGNIPAEDLSALGLPSNLEMTSRVKDLCRLPAPVQEGIIEGAIPFAMAVELAGMAPGLAVDLAGLFRELRISLNKQREVAALITEIAHREAVPAQVVLEEARSALLPMSGGMDRNQTARHLRKLLRQRRFPGLHAAEQNFHALRQRLNLGATLQISPPRDFESIGLTLSATVTTPGDIERLRSKLEELAQQPDLRMLLEGKGGFFRPPSGPRGGVKQRQP